MFVSSLCLALLVSTLALAQERPAAEEDGKLLAFFKQYLDEAFRQQPLLATRLGEHRHDHQLEDLSRASRDTWNSRTGESNRRTRR